MPTGSLLAAAVLAGGAAPLPGVRVTVLDESGVTAAALLTGSEGRAEAPALPAPDRNLSLDPANTQRPYAVYTLLAEKEGWQPRRLEGVQVFDGQQTVARLEFLPAESPVQTAAITAAQTVVIPPHPLWAGGGGSGPAPAAPRAGARVLDKAVIPQRITVHLGRPAESARNVTVSFQEYIANVASSEVYPTWPEQALRANILAQISLALNRIWTEWYPSRGYTFNITGSPAVDQAFTEGRTVYAVMERLTAELFATYVRRAGTAEPYFTEYCDGKLVTCAGMRQWGTVDRANEGLSALQILRYYYGSRVELVTSKNIAAIPESYPGSPLRRGDSGRAVRVLQRQLDRIAKDYPAFGKPAVTGTFDTATETSVRAFQRYFSLTADGIVGRATWYKVSYIYVSVKELAQLTSEGEELSGQTGAKARGPAVVLREGSEGAEVEVLQFWLSGLAQFEAAQPDVTVDGRFGRGHAARGGGVPTAHGADGGRRCRPRHLGGAVRRLAGYPERHGRHGLPGHGAAPGQPRQQRAAHPVLGCGWRRTNYAALAPVAVDGSFGAATRRAVLAFQQRFGLTADGVVGRASWAKLNEVGLAVANGIVEPDEAPGGVPGHAAPWRPRHRRAGAAVLPAAAGGLLCRAAGADGGRRVRRGHGGSRARVADRGRADRGRCGRAADLAERVRKRHAHGRERPGGAADRAARPGCGAAARRHGRAGGGAGAAA